MIEKSEPNVVDRERARSGGQRRPQTVALRGGARGRTILDLRVPGGSADQIDGRAQEGASDSILRSMKTGIAFFLLCVAATATSSATGSTPNASWRCIAGICLGVSRSTIDHRYGNRPRDIPSGIVRVPGGHVEVCFWRCTNAVTEDSFTYYGDGSPNRPSP